MRWDVEVFGGVEPDPEVAAIAPIKFGTPSITVGSDGPEGEPFHPIVYSGVYMETRSPGSISLFGPKLPNGSVPSIRVMENVWHVFFEPAGLEIEGVESKEDGTLVRSRWEAHPAPPSEADEALLREVFGE